MPNQTDREAAPPSPSSAGKGDFFKLFAILVCSVMLVEVVIEWLISNLSVGKFLGVIADVAALATVAGTLGYFLIYRKFLSSAEDNQKKGEELERLAMTLEAKVRERTAMLTTSEAEIHSVIDSSADGIMRFDDKGVIHMANNAAHRLLEYNGIELIGQHISAIIPADHLKILVEGYISSMGGWNNGRPSDTHAARGLKKTGEFIDVELSISECVIGGKTQSVIIMRDVSARKRAEEDLRKAKEEAEEATRLKDKFVSLVAHDLKSPLSSMMGFLQLFGENSSRPLDKDGKDVLMRVIESGRQLNRLIDDLLGLSRLKSGQLKLKMRFFDAKSFVAKICQDFSYSANDKNIKLINDVPDNSRIYADRTLLYEAIQNLITNAIKFCNAGDTVTFSVGVDGGTSIRVQDTGPGMPQDIVDRILKYEVSMSTAGTEGETGTGLGLRFVKDIMQMHGGDMEAECEPEKGCVFTLKIPSVKPRVLIVDDDKNFRFMVRHYLKNYDLELSEADDGATAVDILAGTKNMPHLIISDIEMPKMTGLDLLSYLQTRRDTSSIPVIIISGKHGMEIRDTVYGLGAKDFLTKQIDKDDFIPRVRRYVG